MGAASRWPCKINPYRLEVYLDGYDVTSKNELLFGVKHGFRIHSSLESRLGYDYKNHFSAVQFSSLVSQKIDRELSLDRIAGPFHFAPPGLIFSPLASVPKRGDPGEIRLIHDLSFPKGDSVNQFIPREYCQVVYELVDDCIEIICEIGVGCMIAKADIMNAFRILPIHPDSYRLFGFQWQDMYYFDKCVPMGCSESCQIFEKLSVALQWIVCNKFGTTHMSHILDDFMFFGKPNTNECLLGLNSFLQLAKSVNIDVKHEKTIFPSTQVELHGLLVDTKKMEISLPQDKLSKARDLVRDMSHRKGTTLRELQSLIGYLNFCTKVVAPGRPFLRRLIDLTKGATRPNHNIRLNNQARADLHCWDEFLSHFNGVKLIKRVPWTASNSVKFFSDASFLACAAIFGYKWIQIKFPEAWRQVHIAAKELLPIMLGFKLWADELKGVNVIFLVDNLSIVHVLNSKTSKDPIIMDMIRKMIVTSMCYQIDFAAKHIMGARNILPDKISRLQEDQALRIAPWLHKTPQEVPPEWLPW